MDNKISINEMFLRKILESRLIPDIAISKETLKIPVIGSLLPDTILKLDKDSIRIGQDHIECAFIGVAPIRIILKNFSVSAEYSDQIECRPEIYIKFLGEHKINFLLKAISFVRDIKAGDIKYSSEILSIKLTSYFPEGLPITIEKITVDHGLEIIWN